MAPDAIDVTFPTMPYTSRVRTNVILDPEAMPDPAFVRRLTKAAERIVIAALQDADRLTSCECAHAFLTVEIQLDLIRKRLTHKVRACCGDQKLAGTDALHRGPIDSESSSKA